MLFDRHALPPQLLSFGAPGPLENTLSKLVIAAVPSIEMVRFTNSGTEACMGMLRLARAFTGREKIIKFDGCYHGHDNSFLVKAGSGEHCTSTHFNTLHLRIIANCCCMIFIIQRVVVMWHATSRM